MSKPQQGFMSGSEVTCVPLAEAEPLGRHRYMGATLRLLASLKRKWLAVDL